MRPGTRHSERVHAIGALRLSGPQVFRRLEAPIAFYPGAEFTPAAQVPPAASSAREEEADPTPDSGARADF